MNMLLEHINLCVFIFYIDFPEIDRTTILYFMRVLSIKDNRGVKPVNINFQNKLDEFYELEFKNLKI